MTELTKKFQKYDQKFKYMHKRITSGDLCFEFKFELGPQVLEKITKKEAQDYFQHYFIDNKQNYEIHVTPEMHCEAQKKYREERKTKDGQFKEIGDYKFFRKFKL